MSRIVKETNWCTWPNRKYARDVEQLTRMAIRCDAWRMFFSSTAQTLKKLKGHIIWFNRYEAFDKLLCEFECSERHLVKTIRPLMRRDIPLVFRRSDIYDARAWLTLPLDCFVKIDGTNPRTRDPRFQDEALKLNETPIVRFSIRKKWIIDWECFTIQRRRRAGRVTDIVTFAHPDIDSRFEGGRWCAQKVFPAGTPKKQREAELLSIVREKAAQYLVTITENLI